MGVSGVRVAVYSQACNTEVNCDVYHRLNRLGVSTEVYVPVFENKRGKLMEVYGRVRLWECNTLIWKHPRLQAPVRFLWKCAINKIDVAYLEVEVISVVVWLIWALSRIAGFKIAVQTYENMGWEEKFQSVRSKLIRRSLQQLYRLLFAYMAALPDHIVTVSVDSYEVFRRCNRKTSLLPLGVNMSQFRRLKVNSVATLSKHQRRSTVAKSMKSVKSITPETMRIGYAGRISKEKGVFRAIELFRTADSDSILVIDWPENDKGLDCREVASLITKYGLEDRVCLVRFSHSNMQLYYNAIDVVLCVSEESGTWKEQYGRIPVEAAMCGLMPIMSESGHFKHLPIARRKSDELTNLDLPELRSRNGYCSSSLSTEGMARELSMLIYTLIT